MGLSTLGSGDSKLETVISYLLIVGVVVSLILEAAGVVTFYLAYGHLNILLEDKAMYIQGKNFFEFLCGLLTGNAAAHVSLRFMTLGVVTLILTPYIRVIASAAYFVWKMDIKYFLFTLFVLAVLTASLALH